jgi:Xaa-Pro aminopeptidase
MSRYALPDVKELRAVKTRQEVAYIIKAQRISEEVLCEVVRKLRAGVSEVALARFIVDQFKRKGVKALAFEPIVSFGKNSADIHHEPSAVKLRHGDTAMFDFGCTVHEYCSDMTRTYFFGEPTAKQKRVYQAVLAAQEEALTLLSRGEKHAVKIDAVARKLLHKRFGPRRFTHGLGHGIGTAIHEWPNLKPQSPDVLPVGCVMTVEPGVYIPGWGGVRIEDMVVIQKRGIRNLTHAPKQLSDVIIHL